MTRVPIPAFRSRAPTIICLWNELELSGIPLYAGPTTAPAASESVLCLLSRSASGPRPVRADRSWIVLTKSLSHAFELGAPVKFDAHGRRRSGSDVKPCNDLSSLRNATVANGRLAAVSAHRPSQPLTVGRTGEPSPPNPRSQWSCDWKCDKSGAL
jgi:hypothetical protein